MKSISAYIPSYNNEKTVSDAINSLKKQTFQLDEIFLIDDGSVDKTVEIAKICGVRIYQNKKNKGRGFTRAKAMEIAKNDIVLCCDATNELDSKFVSEGIKAFSSENVASVFGKISSKNNSGTINRWRSTHLFKENAKYESGFQKSNLFITYGSMVRKSHIMAVGNFNSSLVHSEDEEMGQRLLQNGYTLLSNHDLNVYCNYENNFCEVLERYWRWHIGKDEKMTFKDYLHSIKNSIKPMAQEDLNSGNWSCIALSLFCPHYCYFKTLTSKSKNEGSLL